jgi:uncharacterized protein YidB (DUF937 family)
MRKRTLVVSLGAAGALTLTGIGVAIAEPTTTPSPSPSTSATDEESAANTEERRQAIEEALQGLVEDGTLTEEQVGRVVDELDDAPGWGWHGRGHHGWWDVGDGDFDDGRQVVAEALGMTTEQLEAALEVDGTSLADVAEQKGVDRQVLVDKLVTAAEERIAERVADGSLTQERADELKAELPEWVSSAVENDWWSRWADND